MITKKDVKNFVKAYDSYAGIELQVQINPGVLGTTLSKSYLEEQDNINKYRSFFVQLMWYTTKAEPNVANT